MSKASQKFLKEEIDKNTYIQIIGYLREENWTASIEALKQKDLNINYQNNQGNTLLHYICNSNKPRIYEMVSVILSMTFTDEIDLSLREGSGKTALALAEEQGLIMTVTILKNYMAKQQQTNKKKKEQITTIMTIPSDQSHEMTKISVAVSNNNGCPFHFDANVKYWSKSDEKEKKQEQEEKISTNKECYYHDYLRLNQILNANHPLTKAHEEHLFITVHQSYELWFKQILIELNTCIKIMDQKKIIKSESFKLLNRFDRVNKILKMLIDKFSILESMTPLDFLDFRRFLSPASGFQSTQFRLLENSLGVQADQRNKHNGQDYQEVLSQEHAEMVKKREKEVTLFDAVQKWLENFQYTKIGNFDFMKEFEKAVNKARDEDKKLQPNEETAAKYEESSQKMFRVVFNQNEYDALINDGKVRLSYRAFIAGLMIMLYRDYPICQMPFCIIENVIELENLMSKWRTTHAVMVNRMLGSKIGTGGSSGYHYLRTNIEKMRVFSDLFNLSTYLIAKEFLPDLPKDIAES